MKLVFTSLGIEDTRFSKAFVNALYKKKLLLFSSCYSYSETHLDRMANEFAAGLKSGPFESQCLTVNNLPLQSLSIWHRKLNSMKAVGK